MLKLLHPQTPTNHPPVHSINCSLCARLHSSCHILPLSPLSLCVLLFLSHTPLHNPPPHTHTPTPPRDPPPPTHTPPYTPQHKHLPQIVVVMSMLVRVLTLWPALAGLGMTVAIIPLTMLLGRLLTAARKESVAAADARVKLTTEVITGVLVGV